MKGEKWGLFGIIIISRIVRKSYILLIPKVKNNEHIRYEPNQRKNVQNFDLQLPKFQALLNIYIF